MPELSGHRRGPPEPGAGFATVSDMLVKMIEFQDTETVTKLSKTENCIKEMVLHMGTPTVLVPIVDFLGQLEGAKQYYPQTNSVHRPSLRRLAANRT